MTLQIPPHVTNARRSALDDRVFALRNARMRVGRRVSRARAGTRVGPVERKKATPFTVRGRRPATFLRIEECMFGEITEFHSRS